MKTHFAVVSLAASVLLALAACGTPTTASPMPPSVDPAVAPTAVAAPTPTAERSSRGNLIKVVGQPSGLKLETGEQTTSFVVKAIAVDKPCTSPYAQPAKNGHFVAIAIDVATTPDLAKDTNQFVWFGAQSWKFIANNGTTYNGSLDSSPAYGCLNDAERIPSKIGPAEKVTGTLVLDVPATSGTLIFDAAGSGGWEWKFPSS